MFSIVVFDLNFLLTSPKIILVISLNQYLGVGNRYNLEKTDIINMKLVFNLFCVFISLDTHPILVS